MQAMWGSFFAREIVPGLQENNDRKTCLNFLCKYRAYKSDICVG